MQKKFQNHCHAQFCDVIYTWTFLLYRREQVLTALTTCVSELSENRHSYRKPENKIYLVLRLRQIKSYNFRLVRATQIMCDPFLTLFCPPPPPWEISFSKLMFLRLFRLWIVKWIARKVSFKAFFCSLKHEFLLPKALNQNLKHQKSWCDTLCYSPPPPENVTYYLNGP